MMAVEEPVDAELRTPPDTPEDPPAGWFSENSGSGRLVSGLRGWFSGDEEQQRLRDEAACDAKQEAHQETLTALLEQFGDHEGITRDSLARFSAARGDKLDAAVAMVEKHIAWRGENLPIDETEEGVKEALGAKIFRIVGEDKAGRPVLMFAAHRHKASEERDVGDVIIAMTGVMEQAVKEASKGVGEGVGGGDGEKSEKSEKNENNSESPSTSIHPRDDFTTGRFSLILFAPAGTELDLRLVAALASTFQDNYPERLHKLYALPTGVVTRVVWEAVRPFLSQSVASKVVLASGGKRPKELEQALPLRLLKHAIVSLDPMDDGEEDPWDVSDDDEDFVDAEED